MNLERHLQAAITASYQAQNLLARDYGQAQTLYTKSHLASDVVTELDIQAQHIIETSLRAYDSSIGFVGEEGGNARGAQRYWLVDPIDGTGLYVRGIPMCTSMIALIEEDQPVVAVINNFVLGELYTATKGGGAKLNGRPIQVSNRPLRNSYLSVETKLQTPEEIELFLKLKNLTIPTSFINSGYDLALVASGKLDGKIAFNGYGEDWDYAPGALLVAEAQGRVANIGRHDYNFRNHDLILANQAIFSELTSGENPLFPIK